MKPRFGPGIGERFAAAKATDAAVAGPGRAFRRVLQARVRPLLAGGAILVFPTSPCPAPLLTIGMAEQNAIRQASIGVTAIAGFCGLPEVTLPAGSVNGAPVGLSLVAWWHPRAGQRHARSNHPGQDRRGRTARRCCLRPA